MLGSLPGQPFFIHFSLDDRIRNRVPLGIEVDAHLDDGEAGKGKARGVVPEVDLVQGGFGGCIGDWKSGMRGGNSPAEVRPVQ